MDYYSYKKIYTYGDMFSLNGDKYFGFIQYDGKQVTTVDTNQRLTPIATFNTDLFTSRYFRDRGINNTKIILPRTKSQCSVSLNETLNYETLKYKLDCLRENTSYFYSQLFIASNNLPFTDEITYAGLEARDSQDFVVYSVERDIPIINDTILFDQSYFYPEMGLVHHTALQSLENDKFALFNVTQNSFVAITACDDCIGVVEISDFYESLSSGPVNEPLLFSNLIDEGNSGLSLATDTTADLPGRINRQKFGSLGGIACYDSNLYITDTVNNVVLRYDVSGYLNNDQAFRNQRRLLAVVGGEGELDRKTNFKKPTAIACNEKFVAVYDSGNKCIKVYNVDLEYVTTLTLFNIKKALQGQEDVKAMAFDPDFGTLYVLTDTTNSGIFLYRLNVETRDVEKLRLSETLGPGESIKCITFSKTDSNFWYFCTSEKLYKKFKTDASIPVGEYNESRLFSLNDRNETIYWNNQYTQFENTNFKWNRSPTLSLTANEPDVSLQKFRGAHITQGTGGYDKVVMYNMSRLYWFNEPSSTSYEKVLNKFNYINFGSNGFSLSPKEYIQVSVINTELYKVISDILTLKNNIIGRFAGKYENDRIILDNYNYNLDLAELSPDLIESYFLHHNEENLVGALNRSLERIYDLQLTLANIVKIDTGDLTQTDSRSVSSEECFVPDLKPGSIEIEKSVKYNREYEDGETISYTVVLSNSGEMSVDDVQLYDSLANIVIPPGGDPKNIMSQPVTINPSEVIVVNYNYTVTEQDAKKGKIVNQVTAKTSFDGDFISNEVTTPLVFTTESLVIDLEILDKQQGYYVFQDTIKFGITVRNNGNVPLAGSVISDRFCCENNACYTPYDFTMGGTIEPKYNFDSINPGEESSQLVFMAQVSGKDGAGPSSPYHIGPRSCVVAASGYRTDGGIDPENNTYTSNQVDYNVIGCDSGMDVAVLIDYTGSMSDDINEVKQGVAELVQRISSASKGNYRLAMMTVDEIAASQSYSKYTNSQRWQELPDSKKFTDFTTDHKLFYDGYKSKYLFFSWEKFGDHAPGQYSADAFIEKLNYLNTSDLRMGYGRVSIPGDAAMKFTLKQDTGPSELCGRWRNDVAKYIIFLTDTWLGTDNSFRNDNAERFKQVQQQAIEQNVKILVLGVGVNQSRKTSVPLINHDNSSNWYFWRWISENTTGGGSSSWDETINADKMANALEQSCRLPAFAADLPDGLVVTPLPPNAVE